MTGQERTRQTRWSHGCADTGKRTYRTKSAAKRVMRWQQTMRGRDSARPLNVYRCPSCGLFHIGHKPSPGRVTS
jgi:hypothetical protein